MKKILSLFHSKHEDDDDDLPGGAYQSNCELRTLCLLGTGGSGKSSITKRLHLAEEEFGCLPNIYSSIFELFQQSELEPLVNAYTKIPLDYWNSDLAEKLYTKYWTPEFQEWFMQSKTNISFWESIQYFMEKKNFDRILDKQHVTLNREDLFFASIKTTGIKEVNYICDKLIIDTGGQRVERKKWSYISEYDSRMIGFVVSLSEFDELCYEDGVNGRFEEGLKSFRDCYLTDLFGDKDIYLIFSKYEVLEQKIKKEGIKFSEHIKDYTGDNNNVDEIVEFIVKKYMDIDTEKRVVKHFIISARNEQQVSAMLHDIFKITKVRVKKEK